MSAYSFAALSHLAFSLWDTSATFAGAFTSGGGGASLASLDIGFFDFGPPPPPPAMVPPPLAPPPHAARPRPSTAVRNALAFLVIRVLWVPIVHLEADITGGSRRDP